MRDLGDAPGKVCHVGRFPQLEEQMLNMSSVAGRALLVGELGPFVANALRQGRSIAGPGQYEGGEDGSPIIALKAALDHSARIRGQVVYVFVEEKEDRAEFLRQLIQSMSLPKNFVVQIEGGKKFEQAFAEFRRAHADRNGRLPPTFAFIDPFGWTGAPFWVVQSILGQPSCEVFVTFMYEEINRFIGHPDQETNFDAFFGTRDWRSGINLAKPAERNRFLHDLYLRQLKQAARAKYARSFQMRNAAGVTDYYLFYATNNSTASKR
jgi:three-Cys-motif partner protein